MKYTVQVRWRRGQKPVPHYRPCAQERWWRSTCSGVIAFLGSLKRAGVKPLLSVRLLESISQEPDKVLYLNSSRLCWNPHSHREYPFIFEDLFERELDTFQGNFFDVLSVRTGVKSLPKQSFFSTGKTDSAIFLWREILPSNHLAMICRYPPQQPISCCLLRREDHWWTHGTVIIPAWIHFREFWKSDIAIMVSVHPHGECSAEIGLCFLTVCPYEQ